MTRQYTVESRASRRLGRQFINLWLAEGISQFAEALLEITLPVWVGIVTKSPTQVAGVAAAELLPAVTIGPFAGVLAERLSPKLILVLANILRAGTVLLLLAFHGTRTAYVVHIVSFLLSVGARTSRPALSVLVQRTIRNEEIQKTQGALHVASRVSRTLAPALGGTLLLAMGSAPAVTLDAGTFVISTIFLLGIREGDVGSGGRVKSNLSARASSLRRDIVSGMGFFVTCRPLVVVAIVTAAWTFVGFTWFTVDVFFVQKYLELPGEAVSYLWTASGIGDLLAGVIVVPFAGKLKSTQLMFGGLFIRAISLISYSLIGHFRDALLICLGAGFGDGSTSVALSTMAMQSSPPSVLGRVTSTLDSVGQFSGIAAAIIIAATGTRFTPQQDLLSCGSLLLMATILGLSWRWMKKRIHEEMEL